MNFRKVTAIIRPDLLERVENSLKVLNVPGVSVSKVKGYGEYANFFQSDWLSTHTKIEVFTNAQNAKKIAEAIMEIAHTGAEGDGIVAILPVESVYQIRTKRQCKDDV